MIIDKVIYVESPLQFMSSFDYLSKNKNSVILYRKSQPGLEKTISFSCFQNISYPIISFFSLKLLLKLFFSKESKTIGFGYLPSIYSLLLSLVFKNSKLVMFDDGTYSTWVDKSDFVDGNVRFKAIRKKLMLSILQKRKIHRYSMMKHKIERKYHKITRWEFSDITEYFKELHIPNEINELLKNKDMLFFVESDLSTWVDSNVEKDIYKRIVKYCSKNNLSLCILCHRLSKTDRIKKLIGDNVDLSIQKLGYSVELFYISLKKIHSKNKIEFGFTFTSAFSTAPIFLKNEKLNLFKIHRDNFFDDKLKGVDIFYEQIQKDSLRYPNINIIST